MSHDVAQPKGVCRRPGGDEAAALHPDFSCDTSTPTRPFPPAASARFRATVPGWPLPSVSSRVLIIGYGNTLFADDGIGPLIARQVADWCVPGVLALERHELVPELAADLAATEEAIFIDAALAGDHVEFTPLEVPADAGAANLNHALTPPALLALSKAAFGRSPRSWLLTIPGTDFSLGGSLSEPARRRMSEALHLLRSRF